MPPSSSYNYDRPKMYPAQLAAVFTEERHAIIEASTKSGKTHACIAWLFEQAAIHGAPEHRFWWVAPISDQAAIAYRRMKRALPPNFARSSDSTLTITLPNGAAIVFKSGDNPDSLYGEDVHAAVLDEASRMREEVWHAIRSTFTHTNGRVRIIGNVNGRRNWAYKLARRAEIGMPDWAFTRLTWRDAVAGGVISSEEVEAARQDLPELVFNELYEAEAGDDKGNPFGIEAIADCIAPLSNADPVVIGWDLAKRVDYAVGIAMDAEQQVCRFERFQQSWEVAEELIVAATGNVPAFVDSTGVGDPIVERLQRRGTYTGFHMSANRKQQLIEGLIVAIQRREIRFPDGPIRKELESFEFEYTATRVIYQASAGMHDDCVIALALAHDGLRNRPGQGVWLD